ncbi:MAG: hypothetical protein P1Q69_20910, partial [Candidatus Thorarchaeota archaeon]|nr:hypothetical protein [Candidatus Thorarchaeota archaeon]
TQKWIFTNGHVYRLHEGQRSLNQALKIASEISNDRDVLIRKDGKHRWSVYWRHRADTVICSL